MKVSPMASSPSGLEAGSNLFELIEFSLDRHLPDGSITVGRYGVNVTKVREVVRMPKINPLSSGISSVAGVFELRSIPIPAINLAAALGDAVAPITMDQQIIVTEFSHKRAGFIVKATQRIRRVAWDRVMPPAVDQKTCINGMTLVENNEFLFILDLERILIEIENSGRSPVLSSFAPEGPMDNPNFNAHHRSAAVVNQTGSKESKLLIVVEDSEIIRATLAHFLENQGYQIEMAQNGQQGQELLTNLTNSGRIKNVVAIITDVEMPVLDGLSLTRWVKGNPKLRHLPVLLHTSLSGPANSQAGLKAGADAYIIKNDVRSLMARLQEIEIAAA